MLFLFWIPIHFSLMACLLARNIVKSTFAKHSLNLVPRCAIFKDPRAHLSFTTFADMNNSVANSTVVHFTKSNLIALHEWLHLPWFAEIALVTIAARILIAFPLTVNQRKIFHRYEALKPEILAISQYLRAKIKEEAFVLGLNKQRTGIIYSRTVWKCNEINKYIINHCLFY